MKKSELLKRIEALEDHITILSNRLAAVEARPTYYPPSPIVDRDIWAPPYVVEYDNSAEPVTVGPTIICDADGRITISEQETYKKPDLKVVT